MDINGGNIDLGASLYIDGFDFGANFGFKGAKEGAGIFVTDIRLHAEKGGGCGSGKVGFDLAGDLLGDGRRKLVDRGVKSIRPKGVIGNLGGELFSLLRRPARPKAAPITLVAIDRINGALHRLVNGIIDTQPDPLPHDNGVDVNARTVAGQHLVGHLLNFGAQLLLVNGATVAKGVVGGAAVLGISMDRQLEPQNGDNKDDGKGFSYLHLTRRNAAPGTGSNN